MSSNNMNEDLRSIKTKKALYAAMFSLLKNFSFRQITIKGICEEAMISRAAFYTHFIDKYDLLQHWIIELWPKNFSKKDSYEKIRDIVNEQIQQNNLVIKNLTFEADNETLDILFNFVLSTINLKVEKNSRTKVLEKDIVLANFYAGGIISYLMWQIKYDFPSDIPFMNEELYKLIYKFQDWNQNKK